jgi:hypothetical protein
MHNVHYQTNRDVQMQLLTEGPKTLEEGESLAPRLHGLLQSRRKLLDFVFGCWVKRQIRKCWQWGHIEWDRK